VLLTGGNRIDVTQLLPLLQAIPPIRGKRGRPRSKPPKVYADRGYDHDSHRRLVRERGITPVIARRGTEHGSGLGNLRWVVERASRSCTGSAGSASAGRSATTSTRRS
jgi:transposase